MSFINCHVHTFTASHIPSKFLPLGLVHVLKPKILRKPLMWLLNNILPFTDRDILDRYVNFLEVGTNKCQSEVFEHLRTYYPSETKFVVLSLDLDFMDAGRPKAGFEKQLSELNTLYKENVHTLIPFICADPRRENVLSLVKEYIGKKNFSGVKIYPRLGFYPNDTRLYPVYEYAQKSKVPVMTHCSRGGIYTHSIQEDMLNHPWRGRLGKDKPKEFSHYFTEPKNYEQILKDFPKLRICLAHFGGNVEWDCFLESRNNLVNLKIEGNTWLDQILILMRKYKNLYADISYTLFTSERYFPLLNALLDEDGVKDRILFGSDFYMIEREKKTEKEMLLKIRQALGEDKFNRISLKNNQKYLYGEF